MEAAALRRTAKSLPGGASSQSCSPSSGQTGDGRASVLDSEHVQRNALTGAQHQPDTSPLDQPLDGSVQYRQAGNDHIPLTTEIGSQYQALGTGIAADMSAEYLQAGEGSISNAIVDAQHIYSISRDDDTEMPDTTSLHHADALVVQAENGPSAHNNHQTNDDVPRISLTVHSSHMVKPDSNSGAIVNLTMPTFTLSAAAEVLLTIMSSDPAVPAQAFVANLFLSEVAELVPTTLRKMPRLGEPGPLGMRAEHRYDFGDQAGNSNLFVQVVAHFAVAAVRHSVLQYPRAGQITPLAKPTGGHRPLLMMFFLCRLALKSVMAAKMESVAKCAGPPQYGVGRPEGANIVIKTIQYLAEADSCRVLVSLDLKTAFQNFSRRAMLFSIE